MQTVAIIQARMSSRRCPGKVLADLDGVPMIVFMARRVMRAALIDRVVIATSVEASDTPLAEAAAAHGLEVMRGPLDDVLARFHQIQAATEAGTVMRLTGDCPLADPDVLDRLIRLRRETGADYASNVEPRSFPHGLDCEVFSAAALKKAQAAATTEAEREHVTIWMRTDAADLNRVNLMADRASPPFRLTVDYPEDLDVVRAVVAGVGPDASLDEVVAWLEAHPQVARMNAHRDTL